jgi:hypothetical protein
MSHVGLFGNVCGFVVPEGGAATGAAFVSTLLSHHRSD